MKRSVEVADHLLPCDVAFGDAVELLLDVCREVVVDDRAELRLEVVVHHHADVGRREAVLLLAEALREGLRREFVSRERHLRIAAFRTLLALADDIAAVDDRRDRRGVGRGAADAERLHLLDQRRFAVSGRSLREALRRGDLRRRHAVAGREFREQPLAALGGLVVVRGFGIEAQESVEADDLALGDELVLRTADVDGDGRAVELGADHLRGDRAFPDQVVEFLLGRRAFDRLAVDVRRADGLVGLLRALGLGLVVVPRRVFLAVEFRDLLLALRERLLREVHRVGTHVGDQTLLVEVLRHGHGLRDRHAQLAARLLLERRGREGRRGITLRGLLLGFRHRELGAGRAAEERFGLGGRLEARGQLGLEECLVRISGGVELRHDAEIGSRTEGDDFALAFDDQPHLFPQHGRELEAHQPVEDAARLLGVHQVHIDRAGFLDGFEDRPLGDFVEDDAFRPIDREPQHFGQVPCDGLSFAVFIGSEPHGLRLREFRKLVHDLLLVARNLVDGLEAVVDIDSEVLLREVADVSEARFYDIVLAEELLDGLGLGRGLYDD